MYRASNIQYEHSDRVRGLANGGIGAMHQLAQHTGLVEAIDRHVDVLKVALPYHESDHVLGIAYNVLCGGTCLQDTPRRSSGSNTGSYPGDNAINKWAAQSPCSFVGFYFDAPCHTTATFKTSGKF